MVRGRQRSHKVQNAGLNELTAIREELAATSLGPMDSLASISTEGKLVKAYLLSASLMLLKTFLWNEISGVLDSLILIVLIVYKS